MSLKLIYIRLDKLNIPAETLRKTSTPAAKSILAESIENNGILVPILVKHISKTEYEVWDGTRRVTALRELGKPANYEIPAVIVKGGDQDSIIAQININQARERMTSLAEAEALNVLVSEHNWQQVDAAKKLLKSKSWASKVMRVWSMPKTIVKDVKRNRIPLSHAIILSRYIDEPKILDMLYKEALKGGVSRSHLAAMGKSAKDSNIKTAQKERPKRFMFGTKSWVRVEPLQKGKRFEVHLDESDDTGITVKKIIKILKDSSI